MAGDGSLLIDRTAPRVFFAGLLAEALEQTRVDPTPMATAYLVELLEARIRRISTPGGAGETLAEGLLRARLTRGAVRRLQLRSLGDRALFVAGFFGDSLDRGLVGLGYYGDAGRLAYSGLSALQEQQAWSRLFEELADRFDDFVEVLTEVGDRTRIASGGLSGLYARYLRAGEDRDRRRLARRGYSIPPGPARAQ